ncbi:hypothetical protein G6553_13285 [Nocardioides sp. IC4_145]|uniref:sulfotransferase family protein n=1 Tax=Nocardioides sp. IC4_145 TaxID=2714037 RepID=UPI00140AF312|nr:hypothetical protein [Nocardioides sp. IC4_145]NHC24139.1 hypothetical protein [Nocardioides sp. IC4_145]
MKLVIVTGSGRSGTSSVAGTLKRLGLHVPQPEVEADESNPRGYYEPLWVTEFHKRLLNPVPVRTIDTRPTAAEVAAAAVTPEAEAELLEWLAGVVALGEPQVVVKDPREFWVHDLWLRVAGALGVEVSTLTMLRHPTEVVRSRDTAYLTSQSDSFRRQRETANVAAWVNAAFLTEQATRAHRRAFVPYADLVSDWRTAMTRAGDQLGVTYAGALTGPHPVDDFVDVRLNRSQVTWDDITVSPTLRSLADRTWAAMGTLVTSPHDEAAVAELAGLQAEYAAMYDEAAAMASDETQAQVAAVRRQLKDRLATKNERIEKLRAELKALQAPQG